MYTEQKRNALNTSRIDGLTPELRNICLSGLVQLESGGFKPLITEALRTQEYQNALYAQGRQPLEEVNILREKVGLDPIDEDENSRIVTKTTHSKHIEGKAFDVINLVDGEPNYDDKNFISMSVVIYKQLGLAAGADWGWDSAHFELT
jgi:peptidoglycan L-alanyl-D-glutamate endopeptidase CwlK